MIRAERPGDAAAIRAVNEAAFGRSAEADLVDLLRTRASGLVSLVAETGDGVVGHILFSPVSLEGHDTLKIMGLAPMAVLPAEQRRGIGSGLVREGLGACRRTDVDAVVVLGHASYYPRFGFRRASTFGIRSEYDVPDDAFMVLELKARALAGRTGLVRYHDAFRSV